MKKSLAQIRFCWNYFNVKWIFFEEAMVQIDQAYTADTKILWIIRGPKKMQFNHWKKMSDIRKEHQDLHFHFSAIR